MVETSIVPGEVEQFGKLAADWWDPDGASAMLHKLGPVRLKYIRDRIDQHWQIDERSRRPLEGKTALDVGCGAGLLAEPLARLGARVTGIDAAPEVIAVARDHAASMGLEIDYRVSAVEKTEGQFDLVTSMEVIEHVADPAAFVKSLAKRLAPDGLLILSTPNATAWSRLMMITLGRGARPDSPGHARFRQIHRARADEDSARRRRAEVPRRRRHRLVADPRAAPQRRYAAELSRYRRARVIKSPSHFARGDGDMMRQIALITIIALGVAGCGPGKKEDVLAGTTTTTVAKTVQCTEPNADGVSCNRKTCKKDAASGLLDHSGSAAPSRATATRAGADSGTCIRGDQVG